MVFLSYERPVTPENLPALAASLACLQTRIRRRKILSAVCSPLCFLLHTPLTILASVGLFYRLAGQKYRAALDAVPHVKEVLTACFRTLPERIGLQVDMPELVCLLAALLLPLLTCVALTLLLRLCFCFARRPAVPDPVSPEGLLGEARVMSEGSRSRKSNWTLLSGFLSLAAFASAVIYSLLKVRPVSDEWDFKYLLSYVFIAVVAFSVFQLFATLTDYLTELFCGLDARWDGTRLITDLETCIAQEAAPERLSPAES